MNPKISVIIPVYNAENFIAKCIESIINQTYKNLEIILVNDGSSDNSLAICNSFKELDPRVKVLDQKNEGTSSARNNGLKNATGQYIGFVDGDDTIETRMYEILMSTLLKNSLQVVECDFVKSTNYSSPNFDDIAIKIQSIDQAISRIEKPGFYNVWTKLFNLELIKDLEFIHGKIHQDALFVSEVYKRIKKIGYINHPLYIYTVDNVSITRTNYNQKKIEGIDVILKTNQNLSQVALDPKNKSLLKKRLVNYLTYNYNQLFDNPHLDKEKFHRKKIKKIIEKKSNNKNSNIYVILIKYLPISFYKIFHKLNTIRISN